ncbi:NUDIX domain-containing protein [Leptolyngbya sp. NK1-12]|uniref:NUDIX domain-containing protein n=1 Tax=Leptolyngbya sp. NK1-12 TaxID=2547451 RepID=A0AA96WV77_9CYAN|nr:NUDIX domain-containing protein [Leptolyngbya sp. NK1-12]
MSYVKELRAIVGHRPLILAGTVILAADQFNKLLLHRRSDNGTWGLPGGFLELGESMEAAARREFWEETGLALGKLTLWRVFSGGQFFHQYPNGDQVFNIINAYTAQDFQGELRIDHTESLELCFFSVHGLPDNVNPLIQPILNMFVDEFC